MTSCTENVFLRWKYSDPVLWHFGLHPNVTKCTYQITKWTHLLFYLKKKKKKKKICLTFLSGWSMFWWALKRADERKGPAQTDYQITWSSARRLDLLETTAQQHKMPFQEDELSTRHPPHPRTHTQYKASFQKPWTSFKTVSRSQRSPHITTVQMFYGKRGQAWTDSFLFFFLKERIKFFFFHHIFPTFECLRVR